ncbi:MAG: TerB family tellurite resistance protein [Methylococcales bacterium]
MVTTTSRSAADGLDIFRTSEWIYKATAALLVEIMHADDRIETAEKELIPGLLCDGFELSRDQVAELVSLAEQEMSQAADCYQFTSLINKNFEMAQKVTIIEYFWKIAFADGRPDKYEEHFIRKVSELLYVPHREFIAAKHRVDTRKG